MEIAEKVAALAAAIALAACTSSNPPPAAADSHGPSEGWTMYRGDLSRDGHPAGATLDVAMASRLGLSWTAHLDGAVDGTPAISGRLVVAGSDGGDLVALDSGTGIPTWSKHGLGEISSSPAIVGGDVFVTTLEGRAYAFALSDGALVWTWRGSPSSALWASPAVYRNEVILGVASPYGDSPLVPGRLAAVDSRSGRQLWNVCLLAGCRPGDGVWSTPAIDDLGTAYVGVGNPDDGILAFDPVSGARKWMRSFYPDAGQDLDVGATPVVFRLGGRRVVGLGSAGGTFKVFDASSGAPVWSRDVVSGTAVHGLVASPAYDGTNVYAASASPPNGLFALRASDGAAAWRHDTDLPVYSAPAVGTGALIFGTGNVFGPLDAGSITALSTSDGALLWTYDTRSAVRSGPAIAGELVVAGDSGGEVLGFRPKL